MIQISEKPSVGVRPHSKQVDVEGATDPLTQCMNRRAFFERLETHWSDTSCAQLSILILDVDHLKAINDRHGTSLGDEILKTIGETLKDQLGVDGTVCRFGGEEFVALLSGIRFEDCASKAEEIRHCLEQTDVAGVKFTVSIGLSSQRFGSMDPQHLLEQAEEGLNVAKRTGRNRMVRFDQRNLLSNETVESNRCEANEIPFSAVTGLLSALSFRSQSTAKHSIRVADLSLVLAKQMLPEQEHYRLKVAALLHDIGKIGVPDSILGKPGALTPGEWKVMRKHDQIGIEIVRSAFDSDDVARIIESHHRCFSPDKGSGDRLKRDLNELLAGRIIAVCDAFDSLTHSQSYRAAFTESEAIDEMLRFTPEQFEPEVMSHLTILVENGFTVDDDAAKESGSLTTRIFGEDGLKAPTPRFPSLESVQEREPLMRSTSEQENKRLTEQPESRNELVDAREGEFAGDYSMPGLESRILPPSGSYANADWLDRNWMERSENPDASSESGLDLP